MKIKILNVWYYIQTSFWFLPGLMAASAILLSFFTIHLDETLVTEPARPGWLYSGGPGGARTILSSITSSMITVAGVVFSITIVVLSQASSQFGPRLIRNFMNIKTNQMVLGTFVATYMYGLLVLRTITQTPGSVFVPALSVSVAILLAFLSLGVMIYFIHNISESIQAQNIIARVHSDLDNAVDRLFPEKTDREEEEADQRQASDYAVPETCDPEACQVKAAESGYLQAVDNEALMQIAVEKDLLIHIGHRPGNFITRNSTLVTVWPGTKVDDALSQRINRIIIVGPDRTLEQDVEFSISQLVEIAVRALSPGINDPNTAMTCIDWIGDILCKLARRCFPSALLFDANQRLRVIRKTFDFDGIVDAAFNMIRQNSRTMPSVAIQLLETIATIAALTHRRADRAALKRQAEMILHGCRPELPAEDDRADLEERYRAAVALLKAEDTPPS